ncbi:MAG: hypothetical protein ABR564_05085 [Candidatus Dormibacteria bacterium]
MVPREEGAGAGPAGAGPPPGEPPRGPAGAGVGPEALVGEGADVADGAGVGVGVGPAVGAGVGVGVVGVGGGLTQGAPGTGKSVQETVGVPGALGVSATAGTARPSSVSVDRAASARAPEREGRNLMRTGCAGPGPG